MAAFFIALPYYPLTNITTIEALGYLFLPLSKAWEAYPRQEWYMYGTSLAKNERLREVVSVQLIGYWIARKSATGL